MSDMCGIYWLKLAEHSQDFKQLGETSPCRNLNCCVYKELIKRNYITELECPVNEHLYCEECLSYAINCVIEINKHKEKTMSVFNKEET